MDKKMDSIVGLQIVQMKLEMELRSNPALVLQIVQMKLETEQHSDPTLVQ